MVPSGTQFIGFADSVNLTERRSASVNAETAPYTIDDIKGYKVYTALLTQSGGDDPKTITSGNLTNGITYEIGAAGIDPPGSYDFSNVGGPVYPESFSFVATSNDVPNNYASQTLNYNEGAPVVTVLENTIGNIWFNYFQPGDYGISFSSPVDYNKLQVFLTSTASANYSVSYQANTDYPILIRTAVIPSPTSNDILNLTPIEIRIYN